MNINSLSSIGFQNNYKFNKSTVQSNPISLNKSSFQFSSEAANAIKAAALFKINFTGREHESLTPERREALENFQKEYNLEFKDINILSQAFSDIKFPDGTLMRNEDTYQRLECIGDSILGACVIDMLQEKYPDAQQDKLSEEKVRIVCNKNIAEWGKKLGFEKLTTHGAPLADKKYADMLEALLGAIFVDAGGVKGEGDKKVYEFLEANFGDDIIPPDSEAKNYKANLRKYIDENTFSNRKITYDTKKTNIDKCGKKFKSIVYYGDKKLATGYGKNAETANESAARRALSALKEGSVELY